MKNRKIINIVIIVGTIIALLAGGLILYKILTPKKDPMKYDDAVELSKKIKENKTKLEKTLNEINKNKELTPKEKTNQEIKEKNKSYIYKEYEKLSEEEKAKIDAIPREEEVPIEKLDEIIEEQKEIEIPSKFNLADKIDIKVENQKSRGICWAFASLNSIETFLALHYGENYDFSEQHLNYITSNLLYGDRQIDDGGNFDTTENYLAQSGVILEKDVPYDKNYNENEYSKFIDMEPVKTITNTVYFPSILKNKWSEEISEQKLNEYRQAVKRHIMTNGSLYASIAAQGYNDSDTPNRQRYYYISKENPRNFFVTNHAVSIVGWDDDFPKEKFSDSGITPEHNGAYIVLNSWGNYYKDENGNLTGYMYVSYEDMFIESELSGIRSAEFDNKNAIDLSEIKSPSIKKYLLKHFNYAIKKSNGKEYLPRFVTESLTEINLDNVEINLKDLELFPNISSLSITNSKLTSIDDLPELENLNYINLSNNSIENIDKLTKYSNLKSIYLSNNNIKNVSALSNMEIYTLDLSNNIGVTGYGSIKTTELYLNNNGLNQLENLNSYIGGIHLDNNNFDKIPTQLNNIGTLSIKNNKLTSLTGIENYTDLYTLDISQNNIKDISILNNLHIKNLILKDIGIKSLDGFKPEYVLDTLDISNNKGIKGYGNIPTRTLKINNCNIEKIENLNDNVKSIYADDNSISNINNINNISDISINNNKTTLTGTLDVTNIYKVSLINSKISDDIIIKGSNQSYIITNDYNTYLKIQNNNVRCGLQEFQLTEDIIKKIKEGTSLYLSYPILNIDVDVINNKIDITKYDVLNPLYNIELYFDDDDVIISRDRKTITVPDNIKEIRKKDFTIKLGDTSYYGTVNINLQRKNTLIDSIINIFK